MNLRFLVVPTLSTLSLVAMAATVTLLAGLAVPAWRRSLGRTGALDGRRCLLAAWLVSLVATAGSLYLSEGLGLLPCRLCWFQRIAMYPLVVVLGVAMLRGDMHAWKTAVPLAVIGGGISAYHIAVQWLPGVEAAGCSLDVPCSARYLVAYGFVTIPVMAASAFALVVALLVAPAFRPEG